MKISFEKSQFQAESIRASKSSPLSPNKKKVIIQNIKHITIQNIKHITIQNLPKYLYNQNSEIVLY